MVQFTWSIEKRYNNGTANNDSTGSCKSLSKNPTNNSTAPIGWTQLGSDIDGEAGGDQSGISYH